MKRQKMKKALLRLSCLACVLLTLCTCFAVSAFADSEPNFNRDHVIFEFYSGMSVPDCKNFHTTDAIGTVYINGELVYEGELMVGGISSTSGSTDTVQFDVSYVSKDTGAKTDIVVFSYNSARSNSKALECIRYRTVDGELTPYKFGR